MANRENTFIEITPEVLLKAYACGIFPMAESADDPALYWIEPDMRGIIPLEGFHVPARLARTVRSTPWTVHVDRDFDAVIEGCAEPKQDRARTWINIRIRRIYRSLFERGHCHTVEVYDGDELVGGLVRRVARPRFFRREHVPSRARRLENRAGALVARLKAGGYRLLDTQYVTEHLRTFGAVEVPKRRYHRLLEEALHRRCRFCRAAARRGLSAAKRRSSITSTNECAACTQRVGGGKKPAAAAARAAAGGGGGAASLLLLLLLATRGGLGVCTAGASATFGSVRLCSR